ncbi:facilitated trehalose transporter Tret1-like isoform X2 [Galleria mellonella]|nr:facilitated trehalose transporter Tret1-like isoform X2 [Galleria mellonella]
MGKRDSRFSPFLKQCFVTASVCCNIVGHGCILGFPAVLLPQLHQPNSLIPLSKSAESWIASIIGVTLLVGGFVTPPIMSRYGRKIAHIALTIPALVGWFVSICATTFEVLFIGRILQGLSFGMLSPLRSVLIGEYASPKNRGAFLTMVSLAQAFGIFFVHLVGSILSWQKTAVICVFFPFFSLIMTIYSPESPSWLASQGKYDKCRKVFRWLRGDEEEQELEQMICVQIQNTKAKTEKEIKKQNYIEESIATVRKREFYVPIIIMLHAFCMIHFSGGTTMASYSTKIIGLIMGPEANAHFWMIQLDTQRLILNTVAVYVINKVRRRTMLFSVGSLSVVAHLAIAAYVYLKTENLLPYDSQWIPVLLINIQIAAVALGMVPLPSVIAGEVIPLQYKSISGTVSNWSLAGFLFFALKTFSSLIESVGIQGTYVIYAAVIAYNLIIMWFLLPETKGKTLQRIEEELRGRPLIQEEVRSKKSLEDLTDIKVKESLES